MKALYLLRHGQSEANRDNITAGQLDSPLTALGREEALRAGRAIQATQLPIDVIVSSPLHRGLETAEIVAKQIGYPTPKIVHCPEACERYCGDFEGRPHHEYLATPEEAAHQHNVETLDELHHRAQSFLTWLDKTYPDQTILLVSHNGFGKMLRLVVNNKPTTAFHKQDTLQNSKLMKLY